MKIKKIKFKINNCDGSTLIEMLAVIVIFAIIGGIISAIFASSLRGSNKANVTNEIRQNGNYALLQMSRMISYARNFDGISVDGSDESYQDCYFSPIGAGTPTPQPVDYHYLKITSFDGGQIIFSCNTKSEEIIASNGASLVNTSVVRAENCSFNCVQKSAASPPTIKISFTLSEKNENNFFEKKATIPFETSVTLRTL